MKSGCHCWHRHQMEMNKLDACSVSKVLVLQKQLQGRQAQTCLTLALTPQESRLLNSVLPRSSSDSALKHNGPENIWSFGIAENLGEQIMARKGKHFSFSMKGQACCQVLQIVEYIHFFHFVRSDCRSFRGHAQLLQLDMLETRFLFSNLVPAATFGTNMNIRTSSSGFEL